MKPIKRPSKAHSKF